MKPKYLAATIAALCAGGVLAAESAITTESRVIIADAGSGASPGSTYRALVMTGMPEMFDNADWTRFMSMEMGDHGKVVKDAPYSAEAITETTQVLGDGNRISKKTTALLYRDGAGRTRQEQTAPGATVFINDPVAGKRIVLNVDRKRATVLPRAAAMSGIDIEKIKEMAMAKARASIRRHADGEVRIERKGGAAGSEGEGYIVQKSADGSEVQIINEPGRQVIIKRKEVDRGDGTKSVEEKKEVRVSVIRGRDGEESVAIAGLPIDVQGLMSMRAGRHKGVTTSMGTKDFGGVRAEGTQTIATIPAGEIGNEKPIQIISEKWYSPELQTVVYSRQSDPRSGETIYRLNNIRRVAQAPELFAVPAGYDVRESRSAPLPPLPPIPPLPPTSGMPPLPPQPPAAPPPPPASR